MTLLLAVTVAGGLLTLPLALWLDLSSLSERMLRLQADETGRIIDVMRDFYAKEVVARVQGATGAVTATHAYKTHLVESPSQRRFRSSWANSSPSATAP